jgi:hypothetical protein
MCKSMNIRMCFGDQPKDWLNKAETQRGIESSKYTVEVLSHHRRIFVGSDLGDSGKFLPLLTR